MTHRESIVQGGRDFRTRLNSLNDIPATDDFTFEPDKDLNIMRESANPVKAEFYGKGDLTNEQAESLGFHKLPDGASVVDHINQATNVEHILPDGTRHFIPAAKLRKDPRNPDNLISAQEFTDEPEEDEHKERREENQRSRSTLNRGGYYRFIYYPKSDRNSKIGGIFKYNLKEEVPFSLAYYGIYKKSEEEKLTKEQLSSNCLIDSLAEYPKEQEILKHNCLNIYQILDAWNINPICELLKCNIHVYRISVAEKQVRILKFPSRSIQTEYTKTLKICIHEEHFFPYVENTEFLTGYIKKCGWKEDSNWKQPKKIKDRHYFNSINLVKQMLKQKEDYFIPKTREENIEMEREKEKLIKRKQIDFEDYPTFDEGDCRYIEEFNKTRYGERPIFDPNHPNFDLNKLEKLGYLEDDSFIDDIINCRKPQSKLTQIEYLSTIPLKEIRVMLYLHKNSKKKVVKKLKNVIINLLENHKDKLSSEEEDIEELNGPLNINKTIVEKCYYHMSILSKLPEYNNNGKDCVFFADIETITDVGYHKPYLLCWDREDGSGKDYRKGQDCCKKFIDYLRTIEENNIIIYCHNLSYEFTQFIKCVDIIASSIEPRNNRVYKVVSYIFNKEKDLKKITFCDSLAKIPTALSWFGKMFNLKEGKNEMFPYCFFNNNTAFKDEIKVSLDLYEEMKKLFEEKYLEVRENYLFIKSFQCALDYCRRDVETLRQGWNKMREMVLELTGIDYNRVVTISKLSYLTCLKEGCFDGVVECRGKTESFIRNCIVGGRTMVSLHNKKHVVSKILNEEENEEYQNGFNYNYEDDTIYAEKLESKFKFSYSGENVIKKNIEKEIIKKENEEEYAEDYSNIDFKSPRPRVAKENYKKYFMFDVNSLYPGAIKDSNGIPLGKPKILTEKECKTKSFLKNVDEYFIKIRVLKVRKKYDNPMSNYLREDGKRVWTNEIEGRTIYIDRISLEILEEYHEIEWECFGGLYFNEGYNTKIKDLVVKLYEERLKYKKEKNPLELVLKLLLNNIYGTSIKRANEEKTKWVCGIDKKDINKMYHIWDKYGMENVEGWEINNKILKLKIKNAFDTYHWSCCHWGCIILSQSKKILAKYTIPIDEHIIYGDTDSFVTDEEGMEKLKKLYPDSFGNGLGKLKLEHHTKSSNMYIEKGIFLAPKLYLMKEVDLDNGEVYWKSTIKGIPASSREIVCRQKFNGNWLTMFYAMMYRKNKVYFDLLNGGDRIRMEFSGDNQVSTVHEFFRKVGGYR